MLGAGAGALELELGAGIAGGIASAAARAAAAAALRARVRGLPATHEAYQGGRLLGDLQGFPAPGARSSSSALQHAQQLGARPARKVRAAGERA